MCGLHRALVLMGILAVIGLTYANVVKNRKRVSKVRNRISKVRNRIKSECSGKVKEIFLPQGGSEIIQTPGFLEGEFRNGCEAEYEVELTRDDRDVAQWRIKVEVEEINMPCSSASLTVEEDGTTKKTVTYCTGRKTKTFYSHEHLITIKLKNKNSCMDGDDCGLVAGKNYTTAGKAGAQIKVTSDYVCGGRFTKDGGSITSPGYPRNYMNDETCFYDILAPRNKRITMSCSYFHLSTKCRSKDPKKCRRHKGDRTFLQDLYTDKMYEGKDLDNQKMPRTKTNHHTLYFLSNSYDIEHDKNHKYGFHCTYKFV